MQSLVCPVERQRLCAYRLEGEKFLFRALSHHIRLHQVFIADPGVSPKLRLLLEAHTRDSEVELLFLRSRLLRTMSQSNEDVSVMAVAQTRWQTEALPDRLPGPVALVVEAIRSPGNLGTMLRTLEAMGGSEVIVLGCGVDPYHPTCVRATMGSIAAIRFWRTSHKALSQWRRQTQVRLIGASPNGTVDFRNIPPDVPALLAMGCERGGLSEQLERMCSQLVRIPMAQGVDSLNVAVAAGILLAQFAPSCGSNEEVGTVWHKGTAGCPMRFSPI